MYAPSGPPTSGINVVIQMLKLGPGIAFEPYPITSIQSRGPKSRAGFKDAISIGANNPTSAATTIPIASGDGVSDETVAQEDQDEDAKHLAQVLFHPALFGYCHVFLLL